MALPVRRAYKGAPVTTTINSNISNSATSVTVGSVTGWPTTFPFFAVVDPGTSKEEKISVTGITSTTLTIVRGVDDTSASSHDAGATIYPVFTATDANEANLVASAMTTKGDLIATDGSTINRLAIGTNTHVLQADSTATNGFKWAQVATAGIADGAVTSAKIANGTIVLEDLAAALQAFLVPTGSINAWSTNTAPTGWQLCDGSLVSRTTYAALFGVIGETYGAGDGSTTFALPNLKGKVVVGRDASQTEFDTLAEIGGSKTSTAPHTHNIDHNHPAFNWTHDHAAFNWSHDHPDFVIGDGDHGHTYQNADNTPYNVINVADSAGLLVSGYTTTSVSGLGKHTHSVDVPTHTGSIDIPSHTGSIDIPALGTTASGASSAEATSGNLQPYMVLNYIIKN
jgi:microcystin-dependent protein